MLRETQYLLTVFARPAGVGFQDGRAGRLARDDDWVPRARRRRDAPHSLTRHEIATVPGPRAVLREPLLSTRPRNGTRQT